MVAIQGTYSKITTTIAVYQFYVNPFDLYGNLLNEMTIEVDSTLASPTIFLPLISDLNNNWNIKINIIRPGAVDTDLLAEAFPGGYHAQDLRMPDDIAPIFVELSLPSCTRHGDTVVPEDFGL